MSSVAFDTSAATSGSLASATYLVTDAMVRCTGHNTAKTVNGVATKRHDGGAIVSGIGTGSITIRLGTTTPAANPAGYRTSEFYVDGEWRQSLVTTVENDFQDFVVSLGTGLHSFDIVEAGNYDPNPANTTFTTVYSVTGSVALQTRTAPSTKVAMYGDSITHGVVLTRPLRDGVTAKVRQMMPQAWVGMDAIAGRASGSDVPATLAANLAAMLSGATTKVVVDLMGYNDYGGPSGTVSAATFQSNMTAIYTAIIAAIPTVSIIALGPIVAGVETANGAGATLDNIRSAKAAAAAAVGAGVTYTNAKTWITTAETSDLIHPNAAGSAIIAGRIVSLAA